jgi:hypothetical protein
MQFDERVYSDSGLGDWFNKEKWVDISRKEKGKHPPCGASAGKGKRKKNPKHSYPKCRPAAEAASMSKSEKQKAVKQKRKAEGESAHIGKGRKPVMVSHKKKNKKKNMIDENTLNEAKLKRKKSKNKPNNPKLWSQCKSLAKQKFDVYPCLPISYPAITKDGPKYFNELEVGDFIYAFDIEKKTKVLTKILRLHSYHNAPTLDIYTDGHYFCTATKDHKWVVTKDNELSFVETRDLAENDVLFIDNDKEGVTNIEHETGGTDEVWCPETDYGTWYTIIDDKDCVTGNSAYANAWAAKEYKKRGGTWRKSKKNMLAEQNNEEDEYQTFFDWIEERHPEFNQE